MLTEPLPASLDVRKAAARGVVVSGVLAPGDLPRFRPLLAGDEGQISVEMRFFRDEEARYLIRVMIEADVQVECQRCLGVMPEHLSSDSTLAVVWTDEEAARLPRYLDPFVQEESVTSLWDLVADELILAKPPFSYHDTDACKREIAAYPDPEAADEVGDSLPNAFAVLGQLKPKK